MPQVGFPVAYIMAERVLRSCGCTTQRGGLSNTEHNLNNIFLSETSVRVFPSQSRGSLNEDLQDIIYLQLMHQKLFRNSFEGCLQTLKLKANKDCKY